jgi:hypothetical protein
MQSVDSVGFTSRQPAAFSAFAELSAWTSAGLFTFDSWRVCMRLRGVLPDRAKHGCRQISLFATGETDLCTLEAVPIDAELCNP